MNDIFKSARLLAHGAREDIKRLDSDFDAYFESRPFTELTEKDPATGLYVHKLKVTKQLPELLSRDVSRAANDLRSALDQTGYATAVASKNTRLKHTYFPFAADAAHMDDVVKGNCKDLPQDIVTLFRSFKGYRGGDDRLWSVSEIAIGFKHRFIVPVAQSICAGDIEHFSNIGGGGLRFPPVWDSAKDEIVLCTLKEGATVEYKFNIGFVIVFGDVPVVRGLGVISVLETINSIVDEIIDATETESRRIGLIS
jgi:hypothetical protein